MNPRSFQLPASIAALCVILAQSLVAAPVLIDWSRGAIVASPAGDGKYWNSLGNAAIGSDLAATALVDSSNAATGWSVAVDTTDAAGTGSDSGFGGTGVNGLAGADPFDEPNAVIDGIFAQHSAAPVTIAFTGLAPTTPYAFSAIGGRTAGGINGTISVLTGTGSGGTLLNSGAVFNFSATSTSSGNLVLAFAAVSGGSGGQNATFNALSITGPSGPPVTSAAISLNFGIALDDANRVDADEFSVLALSGAAAVGGAGWNNALLRASGPGAPTDFTTATQGGGHIDLIESSGSDAGVDLTSSGGFFANFANVSSPNEALTGDAGLFQSCLLLGSTESVQLTGLSAWAGNGYYARAFFDVGPITRTYGIRMDDSGSPQTFWTADSAGADADPDNDGVIGWKIASATTEGSAGADANYAVFGPFTGDTLTISGAGSQGRAALSGLQIVANPEPAATIVSFTATPSTFAAGQTVTLSWEVANAGSVSINQGVGTVPAMGQFALTPAAATTWTLTATRGGTRITAQATAILSKGPIDVYLLGGQSNMQGMARVSKLPPELKTIPEILFYATGEGVPAAISGKLVGLQPGNGSNFGPEIGIGERFRDLCPGHPIALIKHAIGGSSLEIDWRPGANAADTANFGPYYSQFVNTVNNGLAALEAQGWTPLIHAMCWQQGEQDAKDGLNAPESTTSAEDYGANLGHFTNRVREQFAGHASAAGIRFVVGQVLPYAPPGGDVVARFPGRDLVRQAILDADEHSGAPLSIPDTEAIPTNATDFPSHAQEIDGYRDADEVHQNATAQLALGRAMAYAMLRLKPVSYPAWSAAHQLTGGPDGDDDSDGLTNRAEYVFGGDPANPSSSPRPTITRIATGAEITRIYTVTRNLEASDFVPRTQFSTDLTRWTADAPQLISSIKQADGTAVLTWRSPLPASSPAGFFRTILVAP